MAFMAERLDQHIRTRNSVFGWPAIDPPPASSANSNLCNARSESRRESDLNREGAKALRLGSWELVVALRRRLWTAVILIARYRGNSAPPSVISKEQGRHRPLGLRWRLRRLWESEFGQRAVTHLLPSHASPVPLACSAMPQAPV